MGAAAIVMGGLGVLGALQSRSAGKDAARAQKEQQKAQAFAAKKQQRIADIRASRERLAMIKARRVAQATVENRSQASGTPTSADAGAIGSINSQTSSSMSVGQKVGMANREMSIFNAESSNRAQGFLDSAGNAQANADLFAAGSNVASIFKA